MYVIVDGPAFDRVYMIRASSKQLREWKRVAKIAGVPVSHWVRVALDAAADEATVR